MSLTTSIALRPQPIGIFPFPASLLLLPPIDESLDASQSPLAELMRGAIDFQLPDTWQFFALAARGEIPAARQALRDAQLPEPLAVYNAFVLDPRPETYETARQILVGDLRELLDVAAYSTGVLDEVPRQFSLDGELLAQCLATAAAADLEADDLESALAKLKEAVLASEATSPLLAAMLLAQQADVSVALSPASMPLQIENYRRAIRLADQGALPLLSAELQFKLGMLFQNAANGQRGALVQAIKAYQAAWQKGISETNHPELFAQLQNNLGLAYMAMPSGGTSDQLRIGIAIQSFRHALKIYTPQTHPDQWASASMNLANALQYAPSSHPEENLIKAVEIYEDVLQVRTRAKDPVAYARVLLNQANALAHLGIFKPALEKLAEAYKLFQWYEEADQARTARELVEQINQRLDEQTMRDGADAPGESLNQRSESADEEYSTEMPLTDFPQSIDDPQN